LPTDRFLFLGFLPRRSSQRQAALSEVARQRATLVIFEAPYRLRDTLADLETVLGDRPVALCRELTKLHEEIWRGSLSEALARYETEDPRGEFTLVVGGSPEPAVWDEEMVRQALVDRLGEDLSRSQVAREVAEMAGWKRRRVYKLSLSLDEG
jgi:16S rRNA (cytidine1402-2'-O)-methyltransferase